MIQQILKSGNSLVVSIPAEFVRLKGLKAGGQVEVQIDSLSGKLVYTFSGISQLPLLAKSL
jgi:antitoxin component of MazEF toxin-antitoxin module